MLLKNVSYEYWKRNENWVTLALESRSDRFNRIPNDIHQKHNFLNREIILVFEKICAAFFNHICRSILQNARWTVFKRREIQCESFTLVCTSPTCSILTQSSWIRLTLTSLAKLLLQNISSVWRLLMCENECGCRRQAGGEKSTNKHTNIFHMIGCKAFGCVTCENFVLSVLNIDVLLSEWKWGWWWW